MLSPYSLSIHSPVVPENPLSSGKDLTYGNRYKVSIRLEEEHLLPHPYATNCTDYDALWKQNDKRGPRSQQMCIYTCLRQYNKRCSGCEGQEMMHEDKRRLCKNPAKHCSADTYYPRWEKCKRNCPADCVNQKYHYRIEETPIDPYTMDSYDTVAGNGIRIVFSMESAVTVISHIPQYGEWELFSYIGGLTACWLGISVWAFTGIIGTNYGRLLRLIQKLKKKKSENQVTSRISSGSLHSDV
ncbi:uncharacterized protein CDAR_210071 [Caerostris darwini]|uniref:ShKT domain-containing protein n=1 Tax=Caerostris darwini TaxID=1538125 RepID=A0AAV4SBL2_9ARAC|nr:uncharacterized protein CDAR_210071 [Caerostris darwini]